jgi:methyl-accepting chemotaxis protein
MHERRRSRFFRKIGFAIKFFYIAFIYVLLLMIVNFYATWSIIKEMESALQYSSSWRTDFIVSQGALLFVAIILFTTMLVVIHRSLGPIPRMEEVLERVAKGDYALRVSVRRRDFIAAFAERLNTVLGLLEQKVQGK